MKNKNSINILRFILKLAVTLEIIICFVGPAYLLGIAMMKILTKLNIALFGNPNDKHDKGCKYKVFQCNLVGWVGISMVKTISIGH